MPAPQTVLTLIENFERNLDAYRTGQYNETQVRRDFIDPMFKALGWDMDNSQGYAEAYRDVIHEDAIKVGLSTRAPDYSFRIGGARKFFLEAKKPSVNVKDAIEPAFQVRRYAWSSKLPLSIVTDFEEFAIYDCRQKPDKSDKASQSRLFYCTFRNYAEKWDEIAAIFSKDAVLKGSFDKYAGSAKGKRGTTEVDSAFLAEIEGWRDLLARNIALRNTSLTQRELNFAVQQTIDRIIFLRICEDRGIEPYGKLMALQNGINVYDRLRGLFRAADERYNSGLFHFTQEKGRAGAPDELTLHLSIDDKPLKEIFKNLYYPDCPYEFSVLGADILGSVYEQFLGKVIRLTAGNRAVVEDKPEVKKAGGVFYTPAYIVQYIVQHTVGKLLEGKTSKQAAGITILDPACGSGSFLIGAYQYLLDWYLARYVEEGAEKYGKGKAARIRPSRASGEWRLTTSEKKRILLEHIYGVDIDAQAVEVTKLSLLLKVLEGESGESLNSQMKLFHERVLPDLDRNIQCGNSLIGPDFYDGQLDLDTETAQRINAFDWQAAFPQIFKAGGFDAVIGNPPWGAVFTPVELEYLRQQNCAIIVRMIDSFMYFVHQSTKKLRPHGLFGMILPDVILYQIDNQKLREYILCGFKMHHVLNMGDVFNKVTRPACVLVFENDLPHECLVGVADISGFAKTGKSVEISNNQLTTTISQSYFANIPGHLFITSNVEHYAIWSRVKSIQHATLDRFVDKNGIQRGVSPDLKEAFLVDHETAKKWGLEKSNLRKVLTGGKQVKRYFIEHPDLLLIYTSRNDNFQKLPNICRFIDQFKEKITCKEVKERKHQLYALHRARDEEIFLKKTKILGVITGDRIALAIDDKQTFATDGLYLFGVHDDCNPLWLMGILNSNLFTFVYRLLALESGRVLAQVKPTVLNQLPIRVIDHANKTDQAAHDKLVALVERMLALHQQLSAAKTPQDTTLLQRQITTTDKQIDQLVYALYDLTDEEIALIEKA